MNKNQGSENMIKILGFETYASPCGPDIRLKVLSFRPFCRILIDIIFASLLQDYEKCSPDQFIETVSDFMYDTLGHVLTEPVKHIVNMEPLEFDNL
jgi:hypothetical protein